MDYLPRVRPGLLTHNLDEQVLVYDPDNSHVHLLDPTTAWVLEILQTRRITFDGIKAKVAERIGPQAADDLIRLAVGELQQARLFDESSGTTGPAYALNRREIVRKLAAAGVAGLLVPAVATLTATKGYAQGSVIGIAGGPCNVNGDCTIGLICCNGVCAETCGVGTGGQCPNGPSQCLSGFCCGGLCSDVPCGSVSSCGHCQTDEQCAGGVCNTSSGSCGTGNDAGKLPVGAVCNGNGECCSNKCSNPSGQGSGVCLA